MDGLVQVREILGLRGLERAQICEFEVHLVCHEEIGQFDVAVALEFAMDMAD